MIEAAIEISDAMLDRIFGMLVGGLIGFAWGFRLRR